MTTLQYLDPELIIALNKKVIFVNPNDLQIFKEVELPHDLTKCGLQSTAGTEIVEDAAADDNESGQSKKSNTPQEQLVIQHVKLSPNHQLLAVTTAGQKALLLYRCRMEHAKLLSVRSLARASTALRFSKDSKNLLVTDKTGDCYMYDCENVEAAPKLLLGHLSIVYDVLWTHDMKYIITCDRDDKIRVNNYPTTYDIHGYCLGHKEFVSGLALLNENTLLSISGDKTMRLWNFLSGKQLACIELPAPGIRLAVHRNGNDDEVGKYQVAVLLHQPNECVGIYELLQVGDVESESWKITETELQSYPNMIVSNLCFVHKRLCVSGSDNERFVIKMTPASEVPTNWLAMVEEQFKDDSLKPEDVSAWFKKRYDNVSEYLERKKRRIEEQQK